MDPLLSARLASHEQLLQCRNGARMTTGGLEPEPGVALVPNDPLAVAALQQALVDQGFSLGTGGPEGDGVDGGYGTLTAQAVLAFKQREGLAQPGDENFDGVTSVGTTARLDEIYRHELVDSLVASLAGTPFDPLGRAGDLQPAEVEGLFECPAVAGGRLFDATLAATYVTPTFDAAWAQEGGPTGALGPPAGLPFTLTSGRDAMDFEGGRLIADPAGAIAVPAWAVGVAEGGYDLGEPTAGAVADPLAPAGERVPLERGVAFADPDGNVFGFPDELLRLWSNELAAGTDVGMPAGPPRIDFAAGTIAFPFEQTELSIGAGAVAGLLADLAAAAGDHLRFIVPFPALIPRPDQIRPPQINSGAQHVVNGDAAFPPMIADIRAATAAGPAGFIYLSNWWLRHDYPMPVGGSTTQLGPELAAAAAAGVEVRGIVWDGAALGIQLLCRFNKSSVQALNAAGADILLDGQVQFAGSHHQKQLICFDGTTLTSWVGGIDWNEDRIRTVYSDKPGTKPTPHPGYPMVDDHVRVTGAGAFDLLSSWLDRWEQRTKKMGLRGRTIPLPPPAMGTVIVQVSHTYGPACPFPFGVSTSATTIEHVIRHARNYVYIEDQYLLCTARLEAALIDRLRAGVTVIAVITPNEICELPFGRQARFDAIQRIAGATASSGVGGLNVFEPLAAGGSPTGPRAYTHCKVVIADDQAAVVGSVNSTNRSWTHDSEAAGLFVDAIGTGGTAPGARGFARQVRCDLWAEHGATGAVTGNHAVDVPAFLSGATAGGRLRGYDMINRPPKNLKDAMGEPVFRKIYDPA
jgi:phosphatidylserine/phosphatidylglycerophosphate/cardiolipin synthase-like enzyme/peptidoglycan hydrolase-like protein with peptidoglycan-binding domain